MIAKLQSDGPWANNPAVKVFTTASFGEDELFNYI